MQTERERFIYTGDTFTDDYLYRQYKHGQYLMEKRRWEEEKKLREMMPPFNKGPVFSPGTKPEGVY